MNMNHIHGTSHDDFVARVRESAYAAVPASTLDLDNVLRSSRRKTTTRRASATLATTLALATVGMGAAGAFPGIPGLWSSSPVKVAPLEVPAASGEVEVKPPPPLPTVLPKREAEFAHLAPGVTAVKQPVLYRVDVDTAVLDLGLDAGGGDRYLAIITLSTIEGQTSATDLEILAGGDTTLANLRAGDLGGTLLWRGMTSDAMVLPSDGGPALVFGFSSGAAEGDQFLVFDERQTDGAASAQEAPATPGVTDGAGNINNVPRPGESLQVTPFDVLGDGSVWMRVLQVDRAVTEPRGFVYEAQGTWSASWCRSTSPDCAVIHDVASQSVDLPKPVPPASIVTRLVPLLEEHTNEVPAMEVCVAQRAGTEWTAPPQLTGTSFWQVPEGVDADTWRLCLIDISEALQHVSADDVPSRGGTSQPAPSEEPTESSEDEDLLGLGSLLEKLFGG